MAWWSVSAAQFKWWVLVRSDEGVKQRTFVWIIEKRVQLSEAGEQAWHAQSRALVGHFLPLLQNLVQSLVRWTALHARGAHLRLAATTQSGRYAVGVLTATRIAWPRPRWAEGWPRKVPSRQPTCIATLPRQMSDRAKLRRADGLCCESQWLRPARTAWETPARRSTRGNWWPRVGRAWG